jgi:hypothetical protein
MLAGTGCHCFVGPTKRSLRSHAIGKTLIFNVYALEELARQRNARIVAVYLLKALASEQTDRWAQLVKRVASRRRLVGLMVACQCRLGFTSGRKVA